MKFNAHDSCQWFITPRDSLPYDGPHYICSVKGPYVSFPARFMDDESRSSDVEGTQICGNKMPMTWLIGSAEGEEAGTFKSFPIRFYFFKSFANRMSASFSDIESIPSDFEMS